MKGESQKVSSKFGRIGVLVLVVMLAIYQFILFLARDNFGGVTYLLFAFLGLVALGFLVRMWLHLGVRDK